MFTLLPMGGLVNGPHAGLAHEPTVRTHTSASPISLDRSANCSRDPATAHQRQPKRSFLDLATPLRTVAAAILAAGEWGILPHGTLLAAVGPISQSESAKVSAGQDARLRGRLASAGGGRMSYWIYAGQLLPWPAPALRPGH